MITIDDFAQMEIKLGTIIEITKVPEADKLLKIIVDLGSEKRQIMSGIAEYFSDFTVLLGKQVPVVVNLEPKKFRGYESQGMILMADTNSGVVMIQPDETVDNGTIIR